jgi:hypothetical protein
MERNETKHTPGPWLVANKTFVYALGPQGTNVFWAHVQAAGAERAEEAEIAANARLIAAAPTLLEAVKFTHAALMKFAETGTPPYADLTKSIQLSEDAIALATSANLKEPQSP